MSFSDVMLALGNGQVYYIVLASFMQRKDHYRSPTLAPAIIAHKQSQRGRAEVLYQNKRLRSKHQVAKA
jgi:hypothetical protein